VPGDVRPAYEHTNQARQILNDAEDDLKDWTPDLEDVPSHADLEPNLMPTQRQQTSSSATGTETVIRHGEQEQSGDTTAATDGSRISSGTSVTTGPVYTQSEAGQVA
jgi:hypothetical protein